MDFFLQGSSPNLQPTVSPTVLPALTKIQQPSLKFYKYSDGPEVWDSKGVHYNSMDQLLKTNGGKAPSIQTITNPNPKPVLGPAAPHALWQLPDGNVVNTMQLNQMNNPPAAKPAKESLPQIIKSQFDVNDPRGFAGSVGGAVKGLTNEVQRLGVEGYNVASGVNKIVHGDVAGANAELAKPRTILGSEVKPTQTNPANPGFKEALDVVGQAASLASNVLIPSSAYNIATKAGKLTLGAAVTDLLKTQTLPGALYGAGTSLEQGQGIKDTLKNIAVNALATTVLGTALEGKQLAQLTAQELRSIQTKFADNLVAQGYTREAAAQMAKEGGFLGFFDSPKVQNLNREWDRIQEAKSNTNSKTAIKNYEKAQKKIEDQIWRERQAGFSDQADFIVGSKEEINKLQTKSLQLENRVERQAANEPYVPNEFRSKPIPRGDEAILDRLRLEQRMSGIPREQVDTVSKFIDTVGPELFDDVGMSIRKQGGKQGQFEYGQRLITLFKENIMNSGGRIDRTTIHELWHGLSRYLPEESVSKVAKTFTKEKSAYIQKNPWFQELLDAGGKLNEKEAKAFLNKYPDKSKYLNHDFETNTYKQAFDDTNYQFKNIDEWFAENLTNKTYERFAQMDQSTKSIFAHAKNVVRKMIDTVKQIFGGDTAGKIFDDFYKQKNSEFVRGGNLGGSQESSLFSKTNSQGSLQSKQIAQSPEGDQTLAPQQSEDSSLLNNNSSSISGSIAPKLELPVPAKKDWLVTKLRNQLKPILGTDAQSQAIYKDYVAAKLSSKESANVEARNLTEVPKKEGWQTILDYEKGKPTAFTSKIQSTFDNLHSEAVAKGLDVPYRENYVPQMYKNSPEEVALAVAKYMKDKGVPTQTIMDYIAGKEIPAEIAGPLRLNPSFTKQRVLPDYATAIQYGLAPKYTHPAQLAAAYKQSMEDALANRNLIGQLVASGKLVESKGAPIHFKPIDLSFSPKGYYAEPKLANALNGLAQDQANLTFGQAVLSRGAKTSKFMQELALSAGFPGTDVNFFAIGIGLVKQLTGRVGEAVTHPILATVGAGKDIAAFIRANVDSSAIKFFDSKSEMLQIMAKNGMDLSQRIGTFRDMYKNVVAKKSWGEILGKGWDNAFQKKTFSSLMPMHFVNTFEEAYTAAIKKGMSEVEAGALAADVTRNLHGIVEDVARSKGTEDALSAAFFAPKFREGVIGTLWNTGKSLTTELRNPAFTKNRQLATGIALTYGMYQALNQKYNGNYTWDNEPGHENDLKIPLPGGKNVLYVPFMPSFASMPRNLFSAGKALVTGDFKTATQKISSFASMPIQITTQLRTNRDYFGNPIYKDTDTREMKIQKMGLYLGLQANHPYLKLLGNYIDNKQEPDAKFRKPLIQSMIEASEFPVKFETLDRLSRSQFYDAIDKKTKENADTKRRIQPIYDQVQKLKESGDVVQAQQIVDGLSPEDWNVYKAIKASGTRSDTINTEAKLYKTYQHVQELKAQGNLAEVQRIVDAMSDDEYHAYTLLKKQFNPE